MKLILLLILAIMIFYTHHVIAEIPIVTNEYPPYVISESGAVTGIFPDIVRAAFQESNIDVSFSIIPWKRCEFTVKKGTAYATFPYLVTKTRSENFDFSDPVIYFKPTFFYKKTAFPSGFEWKELKDFQPYVIGGVIGYWYEKSFKEEGLNVQYVVEDRQNIEKLMRGRIDFTVIDELVGRYLIHDIYPEHKQRDLFAVTKKAESSDAFHLMISRIYPNAKELASKFNTGLQAIKNNSTYQKILQRYNMSVDYSAP